MKFRYLHIIILAIITISCNSWLDIKPENEQVSSDFWQTGEEVEAVVGGTYTQLRRCLENMIIWGELRGDMMTLGSNSTESLDMIQQLDIRPSNEHCNWSLWYTVIGRSNSVIKYAKDAVKRDEKFSEQECNSLIAEVVWMRALSYFYLVKTFKEVPLVTEPYINDEQDFNIPKSTEDEVLDYIVADLNKYISNIKPGYETIWGSKGRATIYSYYALLADIYLWQGKYDKCKEMCDILINTKRFLLQNHEDWYDIYYPGNSEESIFELQWDSEKSQGNSLYVWFYNDDDANNFSISTLGRTFFEEFEGVEDIRGLNGVYIANGKIWKYAGTSADGISKRENNQKAANWIIYRYADILLMKAEAEIYLGDFDSAYDEIIKIRERAGYISEGASDASLIHPSKPTNELDAINLLLSERAREFALEGKRWYDLVRVATHNNNRYQHILINIMLANVPAKDRPIWELRLQDPYGYYLPISEIDIDSGEGVLIQNPYYEGIH